MGKTGRLSGAARELVMRRYLAGRINSHEAGYLIGIAPRSVQRLAPAWFSWRVQRDAVIERMRLALERIDHGKGDLP